MINIFNIYLILNINLNSSNQDSIYGKANKINSWHIEETQHSSRQLWQWICKCASAKKNKGEINKKSYKSLFLKRGEIKKELFIINSAQFLIYVLREFFFRH